MNETPLVSICCAAYNHGEFIRDALDGFLMQEVNFPIEIVINDDASTDNTPQILREYEQRHPGLISVVYQAENQYSKGVGPLPQLLIPRARGRYIAVCEGDDFWIDKQKLQDQVDLLESNPEVAACFTNAIRRNYFNGLDSLDVKSLAKGPVPPEDIIRAGGGLYPTASLVFRKDAVNYQWFDALAGMYRDEILILSLMASGPIHYTGRVTCVYRAWAGGVYSGIAKDRAKIAHQKTQSIFAYEKFNELTQGAYERAVMRRISKESLFVLKHLGLASGSQYLRRLRARDRILFVADRYKSVAARLRSAVSG